MKRLPRDRIAFTAAVLAATAGILRLIYQYFFA